MKDSKIIIPAHGIRKDPVDMPVEEAGKIRGVIEVVERLAEHL